MGMKCKKHKYRRWEKKHISKEEHGSITWLLRNGISKVKVQLEMNLAMDMKGNKKVHQRQKEEKGKCGPVAEWSRQSGDEAHGKG